jgi:hypothetical protein
VPARERKAHSKKRRAGIGQIAATMFFGLIAIGKRNTWEKDGATVSFAQVVIGGLVALVAVIGLLALLVLLATR